MDTASTTVGTFGGALVTAALALLQSYQADRTVQADRIQVSQQIGAIIQHQQEQLARCYDRLGSTQ